MTYLGPNKNFVGMLVFGMMLGTDFTSEDKLIGKSVLGTPPVFYSALVSWQYILTTTRIESSTPGGFAIKWVATISADNGTGTAGIRRTYTGTNDFGSIPESDGQVVISPYCNVMDQWSSGESVTITKYGHLYKRLA